MNYKLRITLFLLFFIPFLSIGQCMTVEQPLEDLLNQASLVVEGKVVSQTSYWDSQNKNIYTVNQVKLFNRFKGLPMLSQEINVVTQGGIVDLRMEKVSNALELEVGQMGLFLLEASPITVNVPGSLYRPVETVLGFVTYDLLTNTANGVFESYQDIQSGFYDQITGITGLPLVNIQIWETEDRNITPTTSIESAMIADQNNSSNSTFDFHAGVGDQMFITGADFGEEQGRVLFEDANSGGRNFIAALEHQILEWTSERIIVEVPYRAGTGKIRIDRADGESLLSASDVLIGYDHINVRFNNNGVRSYETQLVNDAAIENDLGSGGYEFQFFTDFATNAGAAQGFENLMETWGCTTGVNFTRGANTTIDEDAADGVNIVRFDNGTELGGSTLAYARSRYRGCFQGGTIKWFVDEVEVVMNDDYNWHYGEGLPSNNQFDFETVMLHEIGHVQQLGHVINSNEVMHFSVGRGQQKRSLSHIDTLGGEYVTDKSTTEQVCGRPLMVHYAECCEDMIVVSEPFNKVVCQENPETKLTFNVDFAGEFQWQIKDNNSWIDLIEGNSFIGTQSNELTLVNFSTVENVYRAVASNSCEETVVSREVIVTPVLMDFSLNITQPTCEAEGSISLERNQGSGVINISLDGGASFNNILTETENTKVITNIAGIYEVVLQDDASGCLINLGTTTLIEPTPLNLNVTVVEEPSCSTLGSIMVEFNDHPQQENLELSIDNGTNYVNVADNSLEYLFANLPEGEYQVMARWEDGTCSTRSSTVSLEIPTMPEVVVSIDAETCELSGKIRLSRIDSSADLEVLIDGVEELLVWEAGQENYEILMSPGSYDIELINTETSCFSSFNGLNVGAATLLEMQAEVQEQPSCTQETGSLIISFNDHPDFEFVTISIDGGLNFQSFADDMEAVEFTGLASGTYEVMGKWEDGSCMVSQTINIANAEILPQIMVMTQQPNCEPGTGLFRFSVAENVGEEQIEISLDGGITYAYAFEFGTNTLEIGSLESGNYQLFARVGGTCEIDLASYRIEEYELSVGTCSAFEGALTEQGLLTVDAWEVYDPALELGCPDVTLSLNKTTFSCTDIGENEIELTITDKKGNTSKCNVLITITDPNDFCSETVAEDETTDESPSDETNTLPDLEENEPEIDTNLELILFPNPSSERVNFQMQEQSFVQVQIYDTAGTMVINRQLNNYTNGSYSQSLDGLSSGLYAVKIFIPGRSIHKTLVVK